MMKPALTIVLALIVLGVGVPATGYFNYTLWAPKFEDARRRVFEESKAYKHGTIRDLQNLIIAYHAADNEEHKGILRQTIQHRVSAFNQEALPAEIRQFIREEL